MVSFLPISVIVDLPGQRVLAGAPAQSCAPQVELRASVLNQVFVELLALGGAPGVRRITKRSPPVPFLVFLRLRYILPLLIVLAPGFLVGAPFVVRLLALEVLPGPEARKIERPGFKRSTHGAACFQAVRTIRKPALTGKCYDIRESLIDRIQASPNFQLADTGTVDH